MESEVKLEDTDIEQAKPVSREDQVKILLVDDLKDNLLALEGLLRRDDVEIFKAKSGTEGLEFMIAHEFAVALVDVPMPGMSGFELAELMRGTRKTKNVPIIFVTATAKDQSFSFKGYESGAVDFLLKPLDVHAVRGKVNIFIELYRQRKELKVQLTTISKSQAEQDNLLTQLMKTQKELEQAVKIRDEFMAIASHELKTPLSTLMLHSHMRIQKLRRGDLAGFSVENLTKMFEVDGKQLRRINHLVEDMLDTSRIGSGKLVLRLEEFDFCELIKDLVDRNTELFEAAACPITVEVCRSVVGSWDRLRIEQVVMNLLVNAMRYGAGTPILVQVSVTPDLLQILVRDQGRGIAPENQARIFRKFERVLGAEMSGMGLGLYIVKQILEAHHGSIRVESEESQGASFIVELPLIVPKAWQVSPS